MSWISKELNMLHSLTRQVLTISLVMYVLNYYKFIKDEVLLTVSSAIFPSILIAKNMLTGSLKNRSIDNLEAQKKSISMKTSQFFDYLLYAKSK
jgi:hypothetical protein